MEAPRPPETLIKSPITERVRHVLDVLERADKAEYIGEPISQLAHGLQAADHARRSGAEAATQLAALLHDFGHLIGEDSPQMAGLGVVDHERFGADYLSALGFGEDVTAPIAAHVDAKRYLCWKNAHYGGRLSEASTETLRWQGGPMDEVEAKAFEARPHFRIFLAVRAWDELAKDPNAEPPGLETYAPILVAHLERGE